MSQRRGHLRVESPIESDGQPNRQERKGHEDLMLFLAFFASFAVLDSAPVDNSTDLPVFKKQRTRPAAGQAGAINIYRTRRKRHGIH
jgi:hypothetical protein